MQELHLEMRISQLVERYAEVFFRGIDVVLKVTERCNLNCTYCYYFNGNDQSFKSKPPLMTLEVLEKTLDFLAKGAEDLGIEKMDIIFHGGEPMLMRKNRFSEFCTVIRNRLEKKLKELVLSI
jgi:uncharacterized protein